MSIFWIVKKVMETSAITFWKKWEDRIAKNVTETRAYVWQCWSLLLLRSILFYIVTYSTVGYHPSTQCRIGLITEVIVISIVNPMRHFFRKPIVSFFSKRFFVPVYNRSSDLQHVDDARMASLFCHSNKSMENLPPTRDALLQHCKRVL